MTTAEDWIGPSTANDRLRIEQIAQGLPPDAADLKGVLLDTTVAGLDAIRQEASKEAAVAQNSLKRLAASVIVGSGVAALASGLLLYGQGPPGALEGATNTSFFSFVQSKLPWITGIQLIGLFAATAGGAVLSARDFGKIWTEQRREAELHRINIVEKAMDLAVAKAGAASPTSLLRQFLEFFRRYQLDLQQRYYQKRGDENVKREGWVIWLAAVLAASAAVSGILGGLGSVHPALPFLAAFLGIAIPILLSSAQSWRTVDRAAEKAAAYKAAGQALAILRLRLSEVRAAADNGDVEAVKKFVRDVHSIMRTESGAFIGAGPVGAVIDAKPAVGSAKPVPIEP